MTPRLTLLCHSATPLLRQAGFPLDEALDARGLAAAQKLAGRFGMERVLTSPLLRALQTAEALGLRAQPDEALRECDYGRWGGQTLQAIATAEPEAVAAWMRDIDAAPHGGESLGHLIARVGAWLDGASFVGHTLAITHSSVVRAALIHALQAPAACFWRIDAAPLSVADLSRRGNGWALRLSDAE
ncbi:histidine phosphatase family protein [Methylovirgula sp. 4M-Z18]|nr:histidine phosphatase family protein [Methylovirgula sp. 4M-Z18]